MLVLFTYLSSVLLEKKTSRCIDKCTHSYSMQKVRNFSCKTVSAAAQAQYPWERGVRYLDRFSAYGPLKITQKLIFKKAVI